MRTEREYGYPNCNFQTLSEHLSYIQRKFECRPDRILKIFNMAEKFDMLNKYSMYELMNSVEYRICEIKRNDNELEEWRQEVDENEHNFDIHCENMTEDDFVKMFLRMFCQIKDNNTICFYSEGSEYELKTCNDIIEVTNIERKELEYVFVDGEIYKIF